MYDLLVHLREQVRKISQDTDGSSIIEKFIREQEKSLQVKKKMELLSIREQKSQETAIRRLKEYILTAKKEHLRSAQSGFERICRCFQEEPAAREKFIQSLQRELENAFSFVKESFGEDQEMLLLVTGITAVREMTTFIAENGCPGIFPVQWNAFI